MRRIFQHYLIALVLAMICGLSPVAAQSQDELHPNAHSGLFQPNAAAAPVEAGDKTEKPAPTLSYLAAVLSAVVVLCIICVPSRKSESMTSR